MSKRVVFAHGWATDHMVWAPYIESLTKTYDNCEVINPDLPGHGVRGGVRWREPDLNSAIDEYLEILDNNIDSKGLAVAPDTIGIGWSLGAQLLTGIELRRPGTFKGLILVAATPCFVSTERFPYGAKRAVIKKMMIDLKKTPREALERFYSLNFTDEELNEGPALAFLDRYKSAKALFDPPSLLNALQTLYNTDIIDDLGSLDLPVFLIHGARDNVHPLEAGRFMADNIKGARFKVFENAGHAPFLTEPDSFLRVTVDFCNEIL